MLLLAAALVAGALWYERSRPRPQVIALVAAMAALAAAGRVVFSPIPNFVKYACNVSLLMVSAILIVPVLLETARIPAEVNC